MNKQDLINKIADQNGISKQLAENVLNSTISTIKKTVKTGDDVKIVNFGTFTKFKTKARTGRNPQTGKSVKVPSTWRPKFRAGDEFRTMVRG